MHSEKPELLQALQLALFALALLAGCVVVSNAQTISASGSAPALVINTAVAGSAPVAAVVSTPTYSVSIPSGTWKITAQLDAVPPAGSSLRVALAAPAGATSLGSVTLTTAAQDVVTSISAGDFVGLGIAYTLTATVAAGTISRRDGTVTFTLVQTG